LNLRKTERNSIQFAHPDRISRIINQIQLEIAYYS
jgi:hypothetical protein